MLRKIVFSIALCSTLFVSNSTVLAQSGTLVQAVGGSNPTPQAVGGSNLTPQAVGGSNPTPQAVGGSNPTPQLVWWWGLITGMFED